MTPTRSFFASEAAKRLMVIAFVAVVTVEYFILYFTVPLVGDDAMFSLIMKASTPDGGASLQGSLSDVWRGWYFDGRLSNGLACVLLLAPRWLTSAFLSLLLTATALFCLRLLAPARFRPGGVVWMLTAVTFLVGWHDCLFEYDLAANYLLPAALTPLYCWLFMSGRSGGWVMAAGVAVAILGGLMQQISFGPLLGASVIVVALQGRRASLRQWVMTICLLCGFLSLLHPKMMGRVGDPIPVGITSMIRNVVIFLLLFIWTAVALRKVYRAGRAPGSGFWTELRRMIITPEGWMLCASWIVVCISMIWGTGARMGMGVTIFSAAGVAPYFTPGRKKIKRWILAAMAVLTVAHLAYADVVSYRIIRVFRGIIIDLHRPEVKEAFYTVPSGSRALTLGKVTKFGEIHTSAYNYWPLYCGLNPTDSAPGKVIIPEVLREIDPSEITPVAGTAEISRYKGYYVGDKPFINHFHRISYGPFSQNREIITFPFHTADGRLMYMYEVMAASAFTLFIDIDRIDNIENE